MLCTSSYEVLSRGKQTHDKARKFGVRSGMPGFIAQQLCPQLIIIPPNFTKYKEASMKIRTILTIYDPNPIVTILLCGTKSQSYSLDEASLDITDYMEKNSREMKEIALEIQVKKI